MRGVQKGRYATSLAIMHEDSYGEEDLKGACQRHRLALFQTMQDMVDQAHDHVRRESWRGKSVDGQQYLGLKALLESDKVYTGNLHFPQQLQQRIAKVAKIDRLPLSNTIPAMRVIRDSWDAVGPS